MTYLIKIQNG